MKQHSSDSLSSDYYSSDDSDYKIKIRDKNKRYCKNKRDPIKLCAKLTEKLLTTAYKLKVLKFKLDEDTLHNRICFLTFIESLDMIFPSTRKLVN